MRPSRVALSLGPVFVTVREAAALIGVTEQAVHKRIRAGRFPHQLVDGVRVLERDGLEARWWGSSQRVADMPERGRAALRRGAGVDGPDWVSIAQQANAYLDCDAWGPPPWPADRWATLRVVIELAMEWECSRL